MKARLFITTILLVVFTGLHADSRFSEQSYELLDPAVPTKTTGKIEVVEIFWYGCPHCYSLEPYLEKWLETKPDDVVFTRIPGVLGKSWIPHARAYFTAEQLGVVNKIHRPLFDAIHVQGEHIVDEKRLKEFFTDQGINGDDFSRIYESEAITDKLKESFLAGKEYKITGVPTIIINGKYKTSASLAGGNRELVAVINQLLEKERQAIR